MFSIVYAIGFMLCAWKWGDWKNWRTYLPTIQYFIGCDMLYNLLTWNYPLWTFPHPPNVLPNHLAVSLFRMFTTYPNFILIYIYRFPAGNFLHGIMYMAIWLVIWAFDELYLIRHGLLVYSHGWNYIWSILFLCVMLPMLRLHHTRPLLTYLLSVPLIVSLIFWFHIPAFRAT